MSSAEYLRELLRPLEVYDLTAPFNGGELDAAGTALDGMEAALEEIQRETSLVTAEGWGLEQVAGLFVRRPAAEDPRELAQALAALLRIGGDSFTLAAVNDTLAGCGVPAWAEEVGVGQVTVFLPGFREEPPNFAEMEGIILDILPAHLEVNIRLWRLIWAQMGKIFPSWQEVEDRGLTWDELELCME